MNETTQPAKKGTPSWLLFAVGGGIVGMCLIFSIIGALVNVSKGYPDSAKFKAEFAAICAAEPKVKAHRAGRRDKLCECWQTAVYADLSYSEFNEERKKPNGGRTGTMLDTCIASMAPKLESVAGNLWTGVQLYTRGGQPVGKVVCFIEREKVVIRYPRGNLESKDRDALLGWGYVMSDDPAIEAQSYQPCN